ncbi:protein CGI121 [Coniella lustricola]|uniref:EKC/KEOPS complex subunit CGI121 n=1 Tax=Coniella lustricola TaxID=2025994 RepID=A0A2T3A0V4_9PEZI|nr:protein CGI121 [Coniella lustricola]
MSLLETITLEHVPAQYRVHAALFRDVANAGFLQAQLLARNPEFEYAFIDATSIVSRLHVLAAVYKALSVLVDGKLRTPNVHAETVIALSASNNISEAYRRYGIAPEVKNIIVVKVLWPTEARPQQPTAEDVWNHLVENVQGTAVPFTDEQLAQSTDWTKINKYYKLNGAPALNAIKDETKKRQEAEALIVGAMALRGV